MTLPKSDRNMQLITLTVITLSGFHFICFNYRDNNNNNVYFKSLSYTDVLFKLEMNAQQNKIF